MTDHKPKKIITPGGYEYDEPVIEGRPDLSIELPYAVAYDVVLDCIESNASIEPLTEPTFKALAENIIGAIVDIVDDQDTDESEQPELITLLALIRDLTDSGSCHFDHHGGCQEHGYLTLRPGELCPHEEAKQVIAKFWPEELSELEEIH